MPEIKKYLTTINRTIGRGGNSIKSIVVHYTYGAITAEGAALANCKYFASGNRGASAHYFIDDGPTIWQSVEDKDTAWSVGSHSGLYKHPDARNKNTLSIEVCTKGAFTEKEVENLKWLVQKKMVEHNIPASNVIRHYDVTGKLCPAYYIDANRWKILHSYITDNKVITKPKTTTPTYTNHNISLKEGMKGAAVKRMQNKLLEHGMDLGKYGADGDFGSVTEVAVKAFQKLKGLVVDGIVGEKTWAALYTTPVKSPPSTSVTVPATDSSNPLLKEGMKGAAVKRMQNKLLEHGISLGKYGADGDFGPVTKTAVKTFQKLKGLLVDGIVGKNTWAALYTAPVKVAPAITGTVTARTGLRVRSGPSTNYHILGTLPKGTKVTIISLGGAWHKIKYGTGFGYVSAQYIQR
ncbi:MAG: peptidoglycan-binding protein [Tenuifilaceae bacterium]|nr:peptidoglycan-binding protein [Tenuifilaceae bacterium]